MPLLPSILPDAVEIFNTGVELTLGTTPSLGDGTSPGGVSSTTLQGNGSSNNGLVGVFNSPYVVTLGGQDPVLNSLTGTSPGGVSSSFLFGLTPLLPAPAVPPVPPSTPPTPDGKPGFKSPEVCPNIYDCCLRAEADRLCLVDWTPVKNRIRSCSISPYDPKIQIPRQGQVVQPFAHVAVPAPGTGNTLVLRYTPPAGYVMVLAGVVQTTDVPFTQGSGDVVWRIRAGKRWLKDFGSTTVILGGYNQPFWIGDYFILLGGTPLEYYVEVPTGASLAAGTVGCGFSGWIYPWSMFFSAWAGRTNTELVPLRRVH